MEGVNALAGAGYAPLAAMILSARGLNTPQAAHRYLDCSCPLDDPFLLTDMDLAAGRVGLAMAKGEKIAVFGDYDVDGITATCLLTDFLRSWGCDCVPYIPGRLEEGYGLNPMAIRQLHDQGVNLIVTVDCGITAMEEAELCRSLGMDLVITDHHECKGTLPQAVAVVDPHRPDGGYPHKNLSGVGVAFKLAAALSGSQEDILARYADMVCLGTVADVMVSVTINEAAAGNVNQASLYDHVARAAGIGTDQQNDKISILVSPFYEKSTAPITVPDNLLDGWVLYAALGGLGLFLLLLIIILLVCRRQKKKKQMMAEASAAEAAPSAAVEAVPVSEGADIMEMKTEKSMELRKDVRKFAEENPEIAAQMVKSWLREGDDAG